MASRLVALCCVLSLAHGSVVIAADAPSEAVASVSGPWNQSASRQSPAAGLSRSRQPGPLWQASVSPDASRMLRGGVREMRRSSQSTTADRSWIERHPVWTGAMIGFAAGFLLTYAVGEDEHALLRPVDPGGPALFWGARGGRAAAEDG